MPIPGQYRYSENELPQRPQKIKRVMPGHKLKTILYILLLAAIIFGVYSYGPQIANAYGSVKNSTNTAIKPIIQIFNPQETIKQYQDIWGSPTVKEQAKKILGIEFVNPKNQTPFSTIAKINVNTKEDIVLSPKCYLDEKEIETEPQELSFLKSDLEQHSSIKCSNSVGGKSLSLKIENPSNVKSVLTVWYAAGDCASMGGSCDFSCFPGEEKAAYPCPSGLACCIEPGYNKGTLKSEMDHSSAYSLLLTTSDDQPLANGDYPLIVKIKRENAESTLKRISSFKISTWSSSMSINCPTISGEREALSKYLVDKNSDTYVVECQLEVNGEALLQRAFIESEMDYTVEEEFKTTLA
ncbi:MAG: hypothetical protein KKE23_03075 [Nanoarchaeota archaeon]|nr:hypothetical protein [Nanoarchaeota archaeon]